MSEITILVSTSPRPTHPSPKILDQTILSIRAQLPTAPIIIMADGVPPDADRETHIRYAGFVAAIQGRYDNAKVLPFDTWHQQSGMLGPALELVQTSVLFYLEDDWNIHPNVEWEKLCSIILDGFANYVRLYSNCRIHPIHEGMMVDRVIEQGVPFVRTWQWSQNPHLASTEFYRNVVLPRMAGRGPDAIENIMHQACACEPEWEKWKLAIYNPMDEGTMQMVTHLGGRETLV